VGRRGPELKSTWQRRSPPQWRGESWSHETRDRAEAHLNREAGFRAEGHVTARGGMHCSLSLLHATFGSGSASYICTAMSKDHISRFCIPQCQNANETTN
jgi:hypothetical protein